MFCRHCGKEIEKDSKFCKHCGESVNADDTTVTSDISKDSEKQQSTTFNNPKVKKPIKVNGVEVNPDDDDEEAEFIEDDIEKYTKVKLTPEMKRQLEDQKRDMERNELLNTKLKKAVVNNLMSRKVEAEINKLGNNNIDMYKRHRGKK